ncbi:unnamed protein product [Adineta ricciae]|uniref:Uncharacterized protein n=1 Tax=Adineta ricciae TaxID=249248 RepID=A0A813TU27_ADIRI|nr:unnamed protein product [Adineta ricciae]
MSPGYVAGYVVYYIIFISLSITRLLTGIHHTDDCPIERYIPIYLIVSGAVSCRRLSSSFQTDPTRLVSSGNVWVFRTQYHVQYDDPIVKRSTRCERSLFSYAYWTIIIIYTCIACTWSVKLLIRRCKSNKDSS